MQPDPMMLSAFCVFMAHQLPRSARYYYLLSLLMPGLRGKSLENNNYKSSYFILLLTCLPIQIPENAAADSGVL